MKFVFLFVLAISFMFPMVVKADGQGKKVQKVNFDETDIDGKVRQPDGSYIVQKRGMDFVPLYKLRKDFNERIENSIEYLR